MSGKLHKQHLGSRSYLRGIAFIVWSGFLLGSVAPDFDHFISLVFNDKTLWGVLHQPMATLLLIGLAFASTIGLLTTLVLNKEER